MKATDQPGTPHTGSILVNCTPTYGGDSAPAVLVVIENTSDVPLYLFDSARMPYLLEQEGELVILYGVNPPDPHVEYFMIEIPPTKVLPPGERVEDKVSLAPLRLGDHYSLARERNAAVTRHGAVTVHCMVGWGKTPILPPPEERHVRNINDLLAWQQISWAAPVEVRFP